MKVLLLNLYYPPDTSATAKMAAAFIEPLAQKHAVTVICGRPSYDPTERRTWRLWRTEEQNGIRVIRVGSTDYPRTQMSRRVFNYLSYVALSVPRALFTSCDVILAMTDPPFEGIVGAFVSMLKGKPFVYNIRDMYPDMAVGGSIVKPGLMARVWEKLHRWALRRASRVIVLGEDMKARIAAKGVALDRIDIVRDGVEESATSSTNTDFDPEVIRSIRNGFRFVLVHAGNLGFYGAWETLLSAARELQRDGVSLVFVGDGAQRARLQTLAAGISEHSLPSLLPVEQSLFRTRRRRRSRNYNQARPRRRGRTEQNVRNPGSRQADSRSRTKRNRRRRARRTRKLRLRRRSRASRGRGGRSARTACRPFTRRRNGCCSAHCRPRLRTRSRDPEVRHNPRICGPAISPSLSK